MLSDSNHSALVALAFCEGVTGLREVLFSVLVFSNLLHFRACFDAGASVISFEFSWKKGESPTGLGNTSSSVSTDSFLLINDPERLQFVDPLVDLRLRIPPKDFLLIKNEPDDFERFTVEQPSSSLESKEAK